MPELPNLDGQPGWVIVVVFALFILGGLGTFYLKRKSGEPETPAPIAPPADTIALTGTFDPVKEAMGHLATSAETAKADADKAEQERDDVLRQLAICERERAVLEVKHATLIAQLAACEAAHRRKEAH